MSPTLLLRVGECPLDKKTQIPYMNIAVLSVAYLGSSLSLRLQV